MRLYGVPYGSSASTRRGKAWRNRAGLVTLADGQDIAQKPRKVSLFQVGMRNGIRYRARSGAASRRWKRI